MAVDARRLCKHHGDRQAAPGKFGAPTDAHRFHHLVQAPAGTTPTTFYVKVLDFRGDARPDMIYALSISGAK
jgi:hypothetical protein